VGGNTLLRWSNPNNVVAPGQIAHVGFTVSGTSNVNILSVRWLFNGAAAACIHQCSLGTHVIGGQGATVAYENNTTQCASVQRYAGQMTVEWHATEVPLENLNASASRSPLRTDVIPNAPVLLQPGETAPVSLQTAPAGANFAVISYKVSSSPTLTGPDVTTDWVQVPTALAVPTLSAVAMTILVVLLAAASALLLCKTGGGGPGFTPGP
jgi:hypothetical protein